MRKKIIGDENLFGLIELCMYGIKGLAAYYYHAEELRKLNPNTYSD